MKKSLAMLLVFAILMSITGCKSGNDQLSADTEELKDQGVVALEKLNAFDYTDELKQKALLMPAASNTSLPDWSGTTLSNLSYFYQRPKETDFKDIASLKFNFVRVPLVTQNIYPENTDWNTVDSSKIVDIDNTIKYGIKNGLHICLDLHDTPGASNMGSLYYENELYDNPEYQEIVIQFWSMLAKRYAQIPNNALSFNIINEPSGELSDETYSALMRRVVEAIRIYSPDRLIFIDTRGMQPTQGVVDLGVAQSFHYYTPYSLTHALYELKKSNMPNSDCQMSWPYPMIYNNIYERPFTVIGNFHAGETIELSIDTVDVARDDSRIKLDADGKTIFEQDFSGSMVGEKGCTAIQNWDTDDERAVFEIKYDITLTDDCSELTLYNTGGCRWFSINYITVPNGKEQILLKAQWFMQSVDNPENTVIRVHSDGSLTNENSLAAYAFSESSIEKDFAAISEFSKKYKVTFMMQEFAVHYKTPYTATTAYVESLLNVAKKYDIRWCTWGFNDEFGFVCDYEQYSRNGAEYISMHKDRSYDSQLTAIMQQHMK